MLAAADRINTAEDFIDQAATSYEKQLKRLAVSGQL
jgi:hypothetical protein